MNRRFSSSMAFARSLSAGLKRGDFFPTGGRVPPQPAPGGSQEPSQRGGLLARIRGEFNWFSRSAHRITLPGLSHSVRVLHLTDIHIRKVSPWLNQLCEEVSKEQPDLVVITGDVVTKGWTEKAVRQFFGALPPARLGCFAVMGNWEHWSGAHLERWRTICADFGIELLQNRWVQRDELFIAGTDDWLSGKPDLNRALKDIPEGSPVLLLTHSPGFFDEISARNVSLTLSGHSHGGQVCIPLLGSLWVPAGTSNHVAGWYHQQESHLFVSRGIGWSIAPLRLWCSPEIPVIDLCPPGP